MPVTLAVEPFGDEHVGAAADLLAARHQRHRAHEPLLPVLEDARGQIESALTGDGTSGAVAVRSGELVAYLIGQMRENANWGRHVWVGHGGQAASDHEALRDAYALAAGRWAQDGARLHLVVAPALEPDLMPWLQLGFAHMHVHGLRETGADLARPVPGLTMRPGSAADLGAAKALLAMIWEHQQLSPSFTGLAVPAAADLRADWAETLAEPGSAYFVAELGGGLVGHSVLYPADLDLGQRPGSIYLGATTTLPEVRGLGIGVALTNHVLAWSKSQGHDVIVTNWRMTNLEASRFWPRRGFRTTFHRLSRTVGSS